MNRRTVLLGAGYLIASSRWAGAQPQPSPVLGYLSQYAPTPFEGSLPHFGGLIRGLRATGFDFDQRGTLPVEWRWAEWRADRLPALAADLVARRVSAIFTLGGAAPALAARAA